MDNKVDSDISNLFGRFIYHFKVWLVLSKNAFMVMLAQKGIFVLFLSGKVLRFAFFFAFLFFLVTGTEGLAGYNINQIMFFFLTFNLVDISAQFLYREVYRFRPQIISGDFDLTLAKPTNALFRALMGGADMIDLVTIPPLIVAIFYVGALLNPTPLHVFYYLLLVANGLLIATAFHITVLSLGIITLEIDHTIMIFRDLSNLGRLPIDIYKQPLKGIITFLIPVGVMITLPAKSLMGLVSPSGIFFSFVLGIVVTFLAIRFWNYALRHYTSASS